MHCTYCEQENLKQSRKYNIENVRERYNPTYFHSQIFGQIQPPHSKVRCTPTFHSQALRVDNYGHDKQCKHYKQLQRQNKQSKNGAEVDRITKNGDSCKMRGKSSYNGHNKWYDQDKTEKFNHIKNTYDYSRQRKFADLASSSVFDGYPFNPQCTQSQICKCTNCKCVNCKCGKVNNGDNGFDQPKKEEVVLQQACKCTNCACGDCKCGQKNQQVKGYNGDQAKQNQQQQGKRENCSCRNGKCLNCACENCLCCPHTDKQGQLQKKGNKCICVNCDCENCQGENCNKGCKCATSKANNQTIQQPQKIVISNGKIQTNQQITFGKKGGVKLQNPLNKTKKTIKQKPTFTVTRQKK